MSTVTLVVGVDRRDANRFVGDMAPACRDGFGRIVVATPLSTRNLEGLRFDRVVFTPRASDWRDLFDLIARSTAKMRALR